jgi:hypothetical protein
LSEATEMVIVEWDTPGEMDTGVHVRATLRVDPDRPAMLTLTAADDAHEALFATAHEIVEALPFLIVPIAIDSSLREPVRASKLKLPEEPVRPMRSSRSASQWRRSGSATTLRRAADSRWNTCINCVSRSAA